MKGVHKILQTMPTSGQKPHVWVRSHPWIPPRSATEAVLLVDALNTFNNLNCQTALHNIHLNCPSTFKALINTYHSDTQLFVDDETFLSQEGTTQGDPLAMATAGDELYCETGGTS